MAPIKTVMVGHQLNLAKVLALKMRSVSRAEWEETSETKRFNPKTPMVELHDHSIHFQGSAA
jgi:hypothetical protein